MAPKTDGTSMTVISTEEEWAKVSGESAEKDMLFMVEVFANWCGPSEAITSTMMKLSGDYNGKKLKFMQARLPACACGSRRLSAPSSFRSTDPAHARHADQRRRRGHVSEAEDSVAAVLCLL